MKSLGWLAMVASVGCGSTVELAGSGHGGASAVSSTSGATTPTMSSGGGGLSVGTSTSSGGIPGDCPITLDETTYFIEVVGDGDVLQLIHSCGAYPYPSAQHMDGGRCPMGFDLSACGEEQARLSLFALGAETPGRYHDGGAQYVRSDGTEFFSTQDTIYLNEVGPVGEAVTGSFFATLVSSNNAPLQLSGKLILCRVPDIPPCP